MARRWRAIVSTMAILVSMAVSLPAQRTVARSIFVSAIDSAGRPVLDLTPAERS